VGPSMADFRQEQESLMRKVVKNGMEEKVQKLFYLKFC